MYFTYLNYREMGSSESLAHHPDDALREGEHEAQDRDEERHDEREELQEEIEDVCQEFHCVSVPKFAYRCGQPAQQQGRRMPPESLDIAFLMRMSRVSAFLPEVAQQIHSFLARGVVESQVAFARGDFKSAAFKSLGKVCIRYEVDAMPSCSFTIRASSSRLTSLFIK